MKKILLTCICLAMIMVICQAQETVHPKYQFTNLSHVAISGDNIYAVGSCGGAQISTDGGATWDIFTLEDDLYIRDLEIKPNTNGTETYLYNIDGLYTLNIDKTLTQLNTGTLDAFGNILGMEINNEYIYIVSTGAIHKALHTTLEWEIITEVIYDTPYVINTTSSSPNNLFIASREGHIFQTSKASGGYTEISNVGDRINQLEMVTDQAGYLTKSGASGPLKTVDGGNTWTPVTDWPENNPVHAYNENIFLTANTNRYFVSTDGGATSTSYYGISDDSNAGLISNVRFTEDGTIYMVGESSTVIRSTDFGETYDHLLPQVRVNLYNIHIKGSSAICNGYGAILISDDSGENWNEFKDEGIEDVNDAIVLDNGKFAIAAENGVSIINNGVIESTAGSSANRIYTAPDNSYLLASMRIGNSHVIAKSSDNGLSWSNKIFNDDYLGRIKVNSDGLIYTASGEGKYIHSSDDGETWEEITLPITGWFLDIVIDGDVALYSIDGSLYESLDNGITLSEIASGYRLDNLHILNDDHYTYTTGNNSSTYIMEKKPGSTTFTNVSQSCGSSYGSYNNGNGEVWYSKAGGFISKYTFDLSTSTINMEDNAINIYPNPITSGESLVIQGLDLITNISITNSVGKEVIRTSGNVDNTEIGTKGLPAGNYYITLSNKDNTRTAKLMIF